VQNTRVILPRGRNVWPSHLDCSVKPPKTLHLPKSLLLPNDTMTLGSLEVSYRSLLHGKADEIGAIELPLQTAAKVDPDDLALDYLRDGTRDNDRRKEIYDAREECYKVVTQALEELDSKLSEATASGNGKLFLTGKMVIELMDSRVNRG
jgi:hypothetical protein